MNRHEFLTERLMEMELRLDPQDPLDEPRHHMIHAMLQLIEMDKVWPILVEKHEESPFSDDYDPILTEDISKVVNRFLSQQVWVTQQQYFDIFGKEAPSHPIVARFLETFSNHPDFRKEWLG